MANVCIQAVADGTLEQIGEWQLMAHSRYSASWTSCHKAAIHGQLYQITYDGPVKAKTRRLKAFGDRKRRLGF